MTELTTEQMNVLRNLCERSFTGLVIVSGAAVKEYRKMTKDDTVESGVRAKIRNLYKRGQ